MNLDDFRSIIDNFFKFKAHNYCLNEDKMEVECTLYECFTIRLSIGDRYGVFGAAIVSDGEPRSMTRLLGKDISLNSDKESIEGNLKIIDDYCRLRLPDKFLDAYYKAYGR